MSSEVLVEVENGKYTAVIKEDGSVEYLRYGEPWPAAADFRSSKFVSSLVYELAEARKQLADARDPRATED